jgi:hypothetical protein
MDPDKLLKMNPTSPVGRDRSLEYEEASFEGLKIRSYDKIQETRNKGLEQKKCAILCKKYALLR